MQLIPRYLVSNRTDLISNETGFVTEYRPVYTRQLKAYKGIDNTLEFRVLNADQKPVSLTGQTPILVVFDDEQNLVIRKDCEVLDDGSSSSNRGLFTATVTENDTLNLKQQYLTYNIYLQDAQGFNSITYSNVAFENSGVIFLSGDAFPGPKAPQSITAFSQVDQEWHSDAIGAQPSLNGNEALHTAAIYVSNYSGKITLQATLDNQVNAGTDWSTVAEITEFSNTEPTPINFNGVFSYVRFVADQNPANQIEKILVRN